MPSDRNMTNPKSMANELRAVLNPECAVTIAGIRARLAACTDNELLAMAQFSQAEAIQLRRKSPMPNCGEAAICEWVVREARLALMQPSRLCQE